LSANSVGQHLAALRFFYIKTLRRAWSFADTPYPKKTRSLPTILSREEVAQLIHAARTPCERILTAFCAVSDGKQTRKSFVSWRVPVIREQSPRRARNGWISGCG